MKKKIKLIPGIEFPKNFIGISSHFQDIKIVWSFNNLTGTKLSKSEDITKVLKNTDNHLYFSTFHFTDDLNYKHFLIANKNENSILFPKYKTIDFIYISNLPIEKLKSFNAKLAESGVITGNFILPSDNKISGTLMHLFEK